VADNSATAYLTGNGAEYSGHTATQLGANDTINIGDAVHAGRVSAWLGANSTVNLANAGSTAFLHLFGDTAGSSLTNMTTINGITDAATNFVRLHFNDYGPTSGSTILTNEEAWGAGAPWRSQVNEASATSLANALNIAANEALNMNQTIGNADGTNIVNGNTPAAQIQLDGHTGLLDWFQYQGNTYIVEVVNTTGSNAAHVGLQSQDIVVKLTGLVDVSHDVNVVL